MVELGRTREWLWAARPADVEAARFRLFVGRMEQLATEPFTAIRKGAEIEAIENPQRRDKEARAYNRRRIEGLIGAERAQATLRDLLELDVEDDDEPEDET